MKREEQELKLKIAAQAEAEQKHQETGSIFPDVHRGDSFHSERRLQFLAILNCFADSSLHVGPLLLLSLPLKLVKARGEWIESLCP